MAFFIWHGWFTARAPFRIHEIWTPEYVVREYMLISLQVVVWAGGIGILPALRYALTASPGEGIEDPS